MRRKGAYLMEVGVWEYAGRRKPSRFWIGGRYFVYRSYKEYMEDKPMRELERLTQERRKATPDNF